MPSSPWARVPDRKSGTHAQTSQIGSGMHGSGPSASFTPGPKKNKQARPGRRGKKIQNQKLACWPGLDTQARPAGTNDAPPSSAAPTTAPRRPVQPAGCPSRRHSADPPPLQREEEAKQSVDQPSLSGMPRPPARKVARDAWAVANGPRRGRDGWRDGLSRAAASCPGAGKGVYFVVGCQPPF
ncbi:uncharacterized protein PSFLO_03180 [Pseudozyma flocculosa]|uniref:Uncharacterized protein n=1 Tax=Pseudozyma flocculosa TaxID=84751 RepID=A0A5C3EZK0_9BASI|nr:uncharacterized protein PSFLO_03180 [Pseudozyma flocculosa]